MSHNIIVVVDDELYEEAISYASELHLSLSAMVRMILKNYSEEAKK